MPRPIIALAALLFLAAPATAAEGWVFRAGSAGFAVDGAFRGLWLACAPGGATLHLATGGTRLQPGVDQTAVVTVDGVALLQRMRAGDDAGEPALRRAMSGAELRELATRLAKGRAAEVAMPAGRFALPLKGSGKAVESLLAACG